MKTIERVYTYKDLIEGKLPEGLYEIVNGEVVELSLIHISEPTRPY